LETELFIVAIDIYWGRWRTKSVYVRNLLCKCREKIHNLTESKQNEFLWLPKQKRKLLY